MSSEFLNIPRLNAGYQEGRTADFDEVEIHPTLEQAEVQATRCMGCGIPF